VWKSKRRIAKELQAYGLSGRPGSERLKFTMADVSDLKLRLHGSVVLWNDVAYDHARQAYDAVYQEFPQLIVYCEVFADVRACLDFARNHGLWAVCRSGGHSTAGFSINSEMIVDLSRLNYVVVDPSAKRAIVGGGSNFGHINATLDTYGLHLTGGACEDVCVGGYTQGGGYGFTARKYGMNCDSLLEALVMLSDGKLVVASATKNADLFWAIRGGTGNNFGVLLQATFQLYEPGELWGFGIRWPIECAAQVLVALQSGYMRESTLNDLGYLAFVAYSNDVAILRVSGIFSGSRDAGFKALAPLRALPGGEFDFDKVDSYLQLNRNVLDESHFPPVPDLSREGKDCAIIDRRLELEEWSTILEAFQRTPNQGSMMLIEPYGGAINEVPSTNTAFVHRNAYMNIALDVFFLDAHEQADAMAFMDRFMTTLDRFSSGFKYQNYPRPDNENYRWNYWGESFGTLLAIKNKYDPSNFFRYPQSISAIPPNAPTTIRASAAPEVVPVPPAIVYEPY
jgi:FAD/FMN-containing dehydrogenase